MKALVTGASRGIGLAVAEALAREGYDLYLTCDRTFDVLKDISEDLARDYAVSVTPTRTDMSKEEEVDELFAGIDSLDLLINNAGISYIGLLQDMTLDEWRRIINVNLDSAFLTSRAALNLMIPKQSGRIINISSIWGERGASMEVAYSASKGGLNAFTRALAKEVAPSNIQVNAIACGVIDTEMNRCFSTEEMASIIEEIPADRLGLPSEVASLAVSLASAPAYLTGQVITIDGGFV
ncbi:3-oxoacyl-[acyl-carrier protein] reductase [Lachnospiraceae bacterium XBB2008]|nr:3-oxoacyl-[acyl-carrier protein] reductase [Lachnospiraceae bacterium XBB2008]